MSKSKKEEFIENQKQEATIKVKTLLKAFAVAIVIIASFAGGWIARSSDNGRVTYEAKQLVEVMNVSKAQK